MKKASFEEGEEKKKAEIEVHRRWVELKQTNCWKGDVNACRRFDNWRRTTSIHELKLAAMKAGSTCFKVGTGPV